MKDALQEIGYRMLFASGVMFVVYLMAPKLFYSMIRSLS